MKTYTSPAIEFNMASAVDVLMSSGELDQDIGSLFGDSMATYLAEGNTEQYNKYYR